MTLPPAILLGTDCLTGLQAARILWRKGVPVVGVADDTQSPYCRTRAVVETMPWEALRANPTSVLEKIRARYGQPPIILCCTDAAVWWLSEHRSVVAENANFLIPKSDTFELLADKSRFYRHALSHGLSIPPTRIISSSNELARAAREMTFPVLVKPPRKSAEWMRESGDLKVVKVESPQDLLALGPRLLQAANELILQHWVRGPDSNMHSLYVSLGSDSEPVVPSIVAKKIRQWPPDVGVGSLATQVNADDVVQGGLRLLQGLGYAGPGSLQFKQDSVNGNFYIIEMNTRLALNFPLFEACGVEATYASYCVAGGLAPPANSFVARPGSKWICWKTDLLSAYAHWKRGDLTLQDWLRSLRGHKWSADLQFDDLLPLFGVLTSKLAKGPSKRSRAILQKQSARS